MKEMRREPLLGATAAEAWDAWRDLASDEPAVGVMQGPWGMYRWDGEPGQRYLLRLELGVFWRPARADEEDVARKALAQGRLEVRAMRWSAQAVGRLEASGEILHKALGRPLLSEEQAAALLEAGADDLWAIASTHWPDMTEDEALWLQDYLDPMFGVRIVAVRDALRHLGVYGPMYQWPLWAPKDVYEGLQIDIRCWHVGPGRNVAGVTWLLRERVPGERFLRVTEIPDRMDCGAGAMAGTVMESARKLAKVAQEAASAAADDSGPAPGMA